MFYRFREGEDDFTETYEGFTSRLMADPTTGHMRFDPMPSEELLDWYYNGTFTRSEDEPTAEKEFTSQVLEVICGLKDYFLGIELSSPMFEITANDDNPIFDFDEATVVDQLELQASGLT
jgi:hypothetical protein